jgi:uncharacterized protein DUF5320
MKGNGKGPEDKGSKTGRGMGFCYGWGKSGFQNDNISGEGQRLGRGYGYEHRWSEYAEKVQAEKLPQA